LKNANLKFSIFNLQLSIFLSPGVNPMSIDKTKLYATFEKSHQRQQRLADMATRKALDLPLEDDVQITTNTTNHGISWVGAVVLAATLLAGGGGTMFGVAGMLGALRAPQPAPRGPSTPLAAPREFKVTFWAEDGAPIEVQGAEVQRGKGAKGSDQPPSP
jgi:hypothetical protein